MKINPVFIPNVNGRHFLTSHVHLITVEGEEFITAPLLTNQTVSLLGLSHHEGLVVKGLIDMTDSISIQASISKAYLSIRGKQGIHVVDFGDSGVNGFAETDAPLTDSLALKLTATRVVKIDERDVPVIFALEANLDVQTGILILIAPSIGETYNAEVVAVDLNLERVNNNRRPA